MAKRRANGEGSIYKRQDGTWAGQLVTGYNVDTGKPARKSFYGRTRGEVMEKMEAAKDRAKKGCISEPGKIIIADWLDTWLNNYSKMAVKPKTWQSYEMQARLHIKPNIGHIHLQKLQTAHIQQLYYNKLEAGKGNGGLTSRGVRYMHTVLRQALEQAKQEGLILINPCDNVRLPKKEKKTEIKYLTVEDVKAFLEAAKGDKHFPAFYLALATGLRRGELLALRWQDLDLEAGRLSVKQNLVRNPNGLTFQEPKTELSKRTVDLPGDVVEILKFHRKRQEQQQEKAGEAWQGLGLVFCNELGGPLDPDGFIRNFKRKTKAAGLEINFHALRNTYATLSLQEGVDFKTISENLGHHDPGFTLAIYAGATESMKKQAAEKVGNLLKDCTASE